MYTGKIKKDGTTEEYIAYSVEQVQEFSEEASANISDYYRALEAEDFRDVVGRNTDYVEDPEECMAVNFSYALQWGTVGRAASLPRSSTRSRTI